MRAVDLTREVMGILVRINAITGWKLPDNEDVLSALIREMTIYLTEKRGDLTSDEIAYSIRNYGLTVKDWGKNLNITLIDQCVCEYKEKRYDASIEEERAAIEQKHAKIELSPASKIDWSDYWQRLLEGAKNGQIRNEFISTYFYDWLRGKMGFDPTPIEIKESFRECAGMYKHQIQEALTTGGYDGLEPPAEIRRRLDILNRDIYAEILADKPLRTAITTLAKALLVKRFAIKNIKAKQDAEK